MVVSERKKMQDTASMLSIWGKELCHAYEMKRMSPSCPKQLNLGNLKFKYTYIDQSARKQNTIKNQNHFRLEF